MRYDKISKIFSEGELIHLEDALSKYDPDLSPEGEKKLQELKKEITLARRWAHQFGKSQH